jgi:hypothetical protein
VVSLSTLATDFHTGKSESTDSPTDRIRAAIEELRYCPDGAHELTLHALARSLTMLAEGTTRFSPDGIAHSVESAVRIGRDGWFR